MAITDPSAKGQWLTANYPAAEYVDTKFSTVSPDYVSRNLLAVSWTISLYTRLTGELVALVEANALEAIKTAGSAAIVTDLRAIHIEFDD